MGDKFASAYTKRIRSSSEHPLTVWYLDALYTKTNGKMIYLSPASPHFKEYPLKISSPITKQMEICNGFSLRLRCQLEENGDWSG